MANDNRKHLAVNEQTYEELAELKPDGVTWNAVFRTLARSYKQQYGEDKTPLNL